MDSTSTLRWERELWTDTVEKDGLSQMNDEDMLLPCSVRQEAKIPASHSLKTVVWQLPVEHAVHFDVVHAPKRREARRAHRNHPRLAVR